MSINQHLEEFDGKPVKDWDPDAKGVDPANVVYRLRLDYDDAESGKRWTGLFSALLARPGVEALTGLVVGQWGSYVSEAEHASDVVGAIVAARDPQGSGRAPRQRLL